MFWFIVIIILILIVWYVYSAISGTVKDIKCEWDTYYIDWEGIPDQYGVNYYYLIKVKNERGKKEFRKDFALKEYRAMPSEVQKQGFLCNRNYEAIGKWKSCKDEYIIEVEVADLQMFAGKYHIDFKGSDVFTPEECDFYFNPNIPDWYKDWVRWWQKHLGTDDLLLPMILAIIVPIIAIAIFIISMLILISKIKKSKR